MGEGDDSLLLVFPAQTSRLLLRVAIQSQAGNANDHEGTFSFWFRQHPFISTG